MVEFLSTVFLGFGIIVMVAAVVMIIGFVFSMPFGVRAAIREHHDHPAPEPPRKPRYRQMRLSLQERHLPRRADFQKAWQDLTHPAE